MDRVFLGTGFGKPWELLKFSEQNSNTFQGDHPGDFAGRVEAMTPGWRAL